MPPRPPRRPPRPRGSVYWHAAAARFCAQAPPDARGRRRSRYFPDEDAAWRWLAHQLAATDAGADRHAGSERLAAYLRRWHAREAANPDRAWAPATTRLYAWAIAQAASHQLARLPVADLSRDHTDTLLADLADDLARKSVAIIRSLLRSALADLADDGVIARNPVRRARPARHIAAARAARCPWTEAQARAFLAAAYAHSPRPALWWLAASCGLRSGELRALTLADLDLSSGTLTVRRPKTRTETRLALPPNVAAALRDHLGRRASLGGPLFSARPGRPLAGATLLAELRRLRLAAGVPPIQRVHDLRHVAASLMLASGYPVPTVAAILGHATPRTTLEVYAHAVPEHVVTAPRTIADVLPYPPDQPAPAVRPAVPG